MKEMKKMKTQFRVLCCLLAMALLMAPALAGAQSGGMLVLGNDLSESQRGKVLGLLGFSSAQEADQVLYVTIDDEKALLGGLVSADKIGSRSISSARVNLLEEGSGIKVKSHNITYITDAMYASALITAGVENADVIIAAPTNVSGTAALAGIFKAYEVAANITLDSVAKAVASEELLLSGELAEFIGSQEAVRLIADLKKMVIDNGWDNIETIRPAVVDMAQRMNISLTDAQIDQVANLLLKFCSLDMSAEDIAAQLQGILNTVSTAARAQSKVTEFVGKVGETFAAIGNWIAGLFRR